MKFGVVVFPGTWSDRDCGWVVDQVLGAHLQYLWHKDADLKGCDCIILPGGFAYGDHLRTGAIARFSPVMESIGEFADRGGLVWGICNGFQILCESGLPATLSRLEQNGQVVFRYCDVEGRVRPNSNPNGSLHNIAGIVNSRGNVLGMMPHPERCAEAELGGTDGLKLFRSVMHSAAEILTA